VPKEVFKSVYRKTIKGGGKLGRYGSPMPFGVPKAMKEWGNRPGRALLRPTFFTPLGPTAPLESTDGLHFSSKRSDGSTMTEFHRPRSWCKANPHGFSSFPNGGIPSTL